MTMIPYGGILKTNTEVLCMVTNDKEKNNINKAGSGGCCAGNPGQHMAYGQDEEKCCCSGKHKIRDEKEKKDLMNRLKRIEGQVRGLQSMLERDAYCPDILVQASAVNAALNSFSKVLLTSHIRTCVAENIREGNDEVIDELAATLQKMMR